MSYLLLICQWFQVSDYCWFDVEQEMMRIMGLSSLVVWLNWFIYCWLVVIPVCLIVSFFLTMDPDPIVKTDLLVVFAFMLLFVLSFTMLIFFFTTFFTDGKSCSSSSWILILQSNPTSSLCLLSCCSLCFPSPCSSSSQMVSRFHI